MRIQIIILLIIILSVMVTYILHRIFRKKRFVKYIPAVVLVPFMIYNFVTMYSVPAEGFQALGRFVMGLFLLIAIIPSLISAIIFDIISKKKSN